MIKRQGQKRHKTRVKAITCRAKRVTGKFKLRGAGPALATLRYGRLVYATGTSVSAGRGRLRLLVTQLRPLRRGRYTLTLRRSKGRRHIVQRVTITIT